VVNEGVSRDLRLRFDEPQDHVGVALAGTAHRPQAIDDGRLDPDQALALGVELGVIVDGPEREGFVRPTAGRLCVS